MAGPAARSARRIPARAAAVFLLRVPGRRPGPDQFQPQRLHLRTQCPDRAAARCTVRQAARAPHLDPLALAVGGLAALCWDGGAWRFGDTLALGAALTFGLYIKMMEVQTRGATRLMTLTAMQIATVAACAVVWVLVTEVPIGSTAGS
ncbi:hypothetical protein LP420_23240 [Massilia sp. B-10]|nr:hypothetical protein LP420_23240 [Massilia sp. B-10]